MTDVQQLSSAAEKPEDLKAVAQRAHVLLLEHQEAVWKRTDRLFAGLLAFEWVAEIAVALYRTPRTWEGATSSIHPHVWQALFLGALIAAFPIFLALTRPGMAFTRQIIAASQMLSSALLIHLSGGRIETHFHVFGSLAFLAFYRDWRVLITASAVVAADHLLRNEFMPYSVFGVASASPLRWLEHAGWVVFEDLFLIVSCRQGVREMSGIAEQRALLEHSYQTVEEKVRQRTEQLHQTQNDLLRVARSAGMAEIATSVLHNVGNVLNSVNVSVQVATSKMQQSPVNALLKAVGLISEHKADLGQFITADEQGRRIPEFLEAVTEVLSKDQEQMLTEMQSLAKNVEHIKQIVRVQQSHAKAVEIIQQVQIENLLEDAVNVVLAGPDRSSISVNRQLQKMPILQTDPHAVLQILINLLSNAKHAVLNGASAEKLLTIRGGLKEQDGREWAWLAVVDNGVGIDPANLMRIFNHGFTTKTDGHGFGLHASANSARNLGGSLTAHSDGPGKGATFTLELPVTKQEIGV